MNNDIEQRLRDIIVNQLCVEESEVYRGADIREDLNADSIDCVELIMDVEKDFGISIPDNDAEKIHTVGQAVDYISQFPHLRQY